MGGYNTGNYIVHTDITDHFPVISQFKITKTNSRPLSSMYKRITTDMGALRFSRGLENETRSEVMSCTSPDEAFD